MDDKFIFPARNASVAGGSVVMPKKPSTGRFLFDGERWG